MEMLNVSHIRKSFGKTEVLKDISFSLEKEGRLILSIPAEKGWKFYINGSPVQTETFADCFVSMELPAGEYEIMMIYTPYGLWAGVAISFMSVMILVAIMYNKKKNRVLS